ncbi:hypothetical protein ACFWBC_19305 [Streptomyces sp. NPDC059985]|uniref:hypothetical protein n=1 Tax=Streptomyces sp. NPDC059985 TaxID=3347025 RepID=UPI0036CB514B
MAEQLITALSMAWDPGQLHDTFQEKVATLIKAGETVERAEPAAAGEDLSGVSKADLYRKAAAAHLPGRSNMTRGDLVKALSRS